LFQGAAELGGLALSGELLSTVQQSSLRTKMPL
jgi:hypothetical protein